MNLRFNGAGLVARSLYKCWVVVAVMVAGCASQPDAPLPRPLRAVEAAAPAVPAGSPDGVIELGARKPLPPTPKSDMVVGTGKFVEPQTPDHTGPKPIKAEGEASFNFEAASIPEVVKAILGEFLQENYVIAPGVAGQVTFATTQPVAAEQAMSILEMLLAMNNYALVWREGRYLILPATEATRGNVVPRTDGQAFDPGFQVRAVPLKYMAATEVEKLLQPFARAGAVLKADNARSLVLLAGTPGDLKNYVDTIRTFDVDWMAGMSFGLFKLDRVEVKDLMPELEALFADQNSPLAGLIKLLPVERLNAVLVITPQQRYLKEVERWVRKLDKGGATEGGARLYVFEVKNVKATDLADRLNEIFTGQAPQQRSNSASGKVAPGLNSTEISSTGGRQVTSRNQPVPPANLAQPAATPTPGNPGDALIQGGEDVRITAVEENNSLLIRATPAQYDVIRSAIRRLDLEPLQVHIEARILSVKLTDSLKYGINWYLKYGVSANDAPTYPLQPAPGNNSRIDGLTLRSGSIVGSSSSFLFDAHKARALVTLLQSKNNATVLSSPSLMVLNNQEASINVGTQIPVTSAIVSNPLGGTVGGSANLTQFRDTGITLNVTPRVNPGGLVYLEIQAEDSSPSGGADATGNQPVDKSTIMTQIAVQSGETVLLGGLIKQNETNLKQGLPYLNRIPIIGGLFGSHTTDNNRTELLVLITPTVVRGGNQEAQDMTEEYMRSFEGLDALIREERRAHPRTSSLPSSESSEQP